MFKWIQDQDDVVVVTMDDPDQVVNTANERFRRELPALLDRLESVRHEIKGVILTSAKRTFFAGADLAAFAHAGPSDIPAICDLLDDLKAGFRRLETLGVPVVATINGAALGGGCELALACHHRIAVDRPAVKIGLPEVSLGLLPGAGGVVRTVRMFGIRSALDNILIPGTHFSAREAADVGLVDDVVADGDQLVPAAKAWLADHLEAVQPWDTAGYSIPGGGALDPESAAFLSLLPAAIRKRTRGAPADAARAIVATAVESTLVDFVSAQTIETRYCAALVGSPVATNIIEGTFFDVRTVRRRSAELAGNDEAALERILVLGNSSMGTQIAALCEGAGFEVTVTDGRDSSYGGGFDAVVETIVGDLAERTATLARVSSALGAGTPILTNSSATSLAQLADFVTDPTDLVGLHFFTPVDRMELVEVVAGDVTSDRARSVAIGLARTLGKTAIVVGDAPGFYANRVLAGVLAEALRMIRQGVHPATVEQAAYQAGFPAGVLNLIDVIGIPVVLDLLTAVVDAESPEDDTARSVLERMAHDLGRSGRDSAAGFYDYVDGRRARLWPRLTAEFASAAGLLSDAPLVDIEDRLLFAGAIAAQSCVESGIVATDADGNVGSILGVGYPSWTGGALRFADRYAGGRDGFVNRTQQLATAYGTHFAKV